MTDRPAFAERFSRLIADVHPGGRGPYTLAEVARALSAAGTHVSASYLSELRNGTKTAPTTKLVEALASFFHVSPAYFFDNDYAAAADADLLFLAKLRDGGAEKIAARAVDLSEESQNAVAQMISHLRKMEGLDEHGKGAGNGEHPNHSPG